MSQKLVPFVSNCTQNKELGTVECYHTEFLSDPVLGTKKDKLKELAVQLKGLNTNFYKVWTKSNLLVDKDLNKAPTAENRSSLHNIFFDLDRASKS